MTFTTNTVTINFIVVIMGVAAHSEKDREMNI